VSGTSATEPDGAALRTAVDAALPGASVTGVQRLPGGLSAATHLVRLRLADGTRRATVLRRFTNPPDGPTGVAATEHLALRVAWRAGLPVPEPLWVDGGRVFGVPALLESRVPGAPSVAVSLEPAGIDALARFLVRLHACRVPGTRRLPHVHEWLDRPRPPRAPEPWLAFPVGQAAWDAFRRGVPAVLRDPVVLAHGDFHLGNVLWHGGHLSGVVDWEMAEIAPPASDLSYLRLDLHLVAGPTAAERARRAYEHQAGPPPHAWFWDLVAASRAFSGYQEWVGVYRTNGATRLTAGTVRRRLERFVAAALAAAHS
jgi:aminoglycoside phosphotransferase (APT) family kinase protein